MALSHIDGVAVSGLSHIQGIAKASVSEILGITGGFSGGSYDSDSTAFFTATGITDTTQKNAIDGLVVALKGYGIWTKCYAIYPLAGGTATTHKYNLKNPADTDGAFRIAYTGSWTHNANGITGDGSTTYGDTKLTPSTTMTLNDVHLSIYSRSSANRSSDTDLGADNFNSSTDVLALRIRRGDLASFNGHDSSSLVSVTNNTSAAGFFLGTRRGSADAELYRNGSSIATQTGTGTGARVPRSIYIGAINFAFFAGAVEFSNRNYAFASIGTGLTDTEAANFYTAVQAFQTALSRQV